MKFIQDRVVRAALLCLVAAMVVGVILAFAGVISWTLFIFSAIMLTFCLGPLFEYRQVI